MAERRAENQQREKLRHELANKTTIFQMVRDAKLYDLPAYLDAADLALAKNPANGPRLTEFLKSKDSGIRYWGAVGMLMLGKADATAQISLESVLADPCGEVRAMAAWVLMQSGKPEKAQQALADMLKQHAPATLMALNILDWSHADLAPFVAALDSLPTQGGSMTDYEQRMTEYLRESHGLPVPASTQDVNKKRQKADLKKDL